MLKESVRTLPGFSVIVSDGANNKASFHANGFLSLVL